MILRSRESPEDVWHQLTTWLVQAASTGLPVPVQVEGVEPEQIVLLVQLDSGTRQRVRVRLVKVGDNDAFVEIATIVCWEHQLDSREAMIRNSQLVFGHLELRPDHQKYWYRHTLWLWALGPPWEQFAGALGLISSVGDLLETEITGEDNW